MENASKAFLMAGGILIAILIIGALLLMVTQIGDYQKTKDSGAKATQIAKFNSDFERYLDDKGIKGTDIVSLINKIADYNTKQANNTGSTSGVTNYVDYNVKMSITISGLDEFNEKYAYDNLTNDDKLFNPTAYGELKYDTTTADGTKLIKKMKEFTDLQDKASIANLKKISSFYTKGTTEQQIIDELKNLGEENIAKDVEDGIISMDTIKKYTQYSEFKTSTFKSYREPDYKNGQIQNLYFEFIK